MQNTGAKEMRVEKFQFSNAEELKNWLNQFNKIDLSQVSVGNVVLLWKEENDDSGNKIFSASFESPLKGE